MSRASGSRQAVHIGADALSIARHRRWEPARSCLDTVTRMSRLCTAAGIDRQIILTGGETTTGNVRSAITRAVGDLRDGAEFVLTFSGHTERGVEYGPRWCLNDGALEFRDLARLLSKVPETSTTVVVVDSCYAAALAEFSDWPCTVVLLAACGTNQTLLNLSTSEFIVRLEHLVTGAGASSAEFTTYLQLKEELQRETPDAERPEIWSNRPAVLASRHPFLVPRCSRPVNGSPTRPRSKP